MLKTICIVAVFYSLVILCSCQKGIDSVNDTPLDTSSIPAGESYIPLTEGTTWVYIDSATSGYDTATVLSDEFVHDNIPFKKVHIVSATDDSYSYYGILNNNYYLNAEQNGISLTMLVLNDLASAGDTWLYDMGLLNGVPARGAGTVLEKNISYTVQGKTYQNVIHTQYILSYSISGTYVPFGAYNFYFAKGIGVIKVQSSISDGTGGNSVSEQELVDYAIK